MYPTITKVTLATNSLELPVILVTFDSCPKWASRNNVDVLKALSFTTYSTVSMLERLRTSRFGIKKFTDRESVCYPAGETSSLDDVIMDLLVLGYQIDMSGVPFLPALFEHKFGKIPFTVGLNSRHMIRDLLSR